jgi:ParB family chromosome partitioning protein
MKNLKNSDNQFKIEDCILFIETIEFSHLRTRRKLNQTILAQLARSMQGIGQLNPIGVCKREKEYELIYGERRLRAAKMLGWKDIQARVYHVEDDNVILTIMAAENLHNENQKAIEEIEIIKQYKDAGYDNIAISSFLCKSLEWIEDHEYVMRVPQARMIAETGALLDAASLKAFMSFPASVRNILMETI